MFLQDFNFDIVHQFASYMQYVDCLNCPVFNLSYDKLILQLQHVQPKDEFLSGIKAAIANPSD